MRKFLISMLLASAVATPAMAAQRDRGETRAEREAAREERSQARVERRQSVDSAASAPAEMREVREPRADRPDRDPRIERSQLQQQQVERPARLRDPSRPAIDRSQVQQTREQRQDMFQQRQERRDVRRDAARQERIERQQALHNARPPVVSTTPRPGTQPPPPATARPATSQAHRWSSSSWRNDRRYDWYNYRNKYWWLFQLGFYNDPFGWGYQPYQTGWRMWPSYYQSNYWISDPWYYRLPYAPPGMRWVRYWDDAVLVDTWSGQVVDVIYNFFW